MGISGGFAGMENLWLSDILILYLHNMPSINFQVKKKKKKAEYLCMYLAAAEINRMVALQSAGVLTSCPLWAGL